MRIFIVGGGPGGLYLAIRMKRLDPSHEITLVERDGPDDTFGWGIVFSDQTFSFLENGDRPSFERIVGSCQTWDNVDVVIGDRRITIKGNRFSGISRLTFLQILQQRCRELDVDLRFRTVFAEEEPLPECDLVVGADGANSVVRRRFAHAFGPSVDLRRNKYIWLGTPRLFHALTLTFRRSEAGVFAAHSYKFSADRSTFIVECSEDTWARAELSGLSERDTCAYLERVFAPDLDGQPLLANNFVKWINFPLIRNRAWFHDHIVLLGDALHTAHFSIGSGTKLAVEDAIALADALVKKGSVQSGLEEFEGVRRPRIERYQEAAHESLVWFERMEEYASLPPMALAYSLMTRSRRIDKEKLRARDPDFVAAYERETRIDQR